MPPETFKSTDLPWRVISSPVQEGGEACIGRRYTGHPTFETTKLTAGQYALPSDNDGALIFLVTNVPPDAEKDTEYSVEAVATGFRIKYNQILAAYRAKIQREGYKDIPLDPPGSKLIIENAE